MFFVEWWFVERLFINLLLIAVGMVVVWAVRRKSSSVRLPVQFVGSVVTLGGLGFLLFGWWAFTSSHIFSNPVYSPNRKMAVRIDDFSAGAFGGSYDSVELFRTWGLRSDVVFAGEWESVEPASLRWKSDRELEIVHRGQIYSCASTPEVTVHCIVKY